VLRSPLGYMEGYYTFVRPDGEEFRVEVPRFRLEGPLIMPGTFPEPRDEGDARGQMH
jgi:hypothetical protein